MRKLSFLVVAFVVFVSTFSLTAKAQSSDATVQTAPATNAPLITNQVDETNLATIRILAPSASMGFEDRGPVNPTLVIEGQLLLKRSPAQEKALELWKTQVGTPTDPNYGQTLTPKVYSETFGADKSDVATLVSWLMSHNIEVTSSSRGKLAINFTGAVVDLETAFHTQIHSYLAPDGKVYYAPSTDLKFPKAFSDIIDHPVGLNSMATMSLPGYDAPVTANGEKFAPEATDTSAKAEPRPSLPDLLETNHTPVAVHKVRPDLLTPTMAVTVSPTTIQGATVVSPTITATLTFTGATAPTGTFTFMDGNYLINLTVNATTCTTGATTVVCTQAFSSAPIGGYTPDNIYAAYSGDSNFNSAYNATAATLAYTGPTGTHAIGGFSLSVTSGAQTPGTGSSQSIVVTLTGTATGGVPTGTVIVAGSAQLGLLFSSTLGSDARCVLVTRTYTCTYPWSPAANTPAGEYQILTGYSGSSTYEGPYGVTATFNFKVINTTGTTTTTVAQSNPPGTTNTSLPSSTITTVTTWTGAGAQATGNLQLTGTFANEGDTAVTQIYGTVSYPTVGNTTSSGFGGFVTANFSPAVDAVGQPFTYSYTCTENGTALTVTCNTTIPNLGAALTATGSNTITATYYGDATYKDSSGTTTVILSSGATASTTTLSAGTAAYASPVTYTTTISTATTNPTGSYVLSGTPIGTFPLSTTINTTGTTPCVVTTDVKTCTNSVTLPAAATVGSVYTVTSAYSGTATIAPSSGTASVTIVKQTPTFGTMSVIPSSVGTGTNTPVALSDTLIYVGSGVPPSGAVTYTLNGVGYVASCTGSSSPLTCTYTVPGATIALLATGSYTITVAYTADANYAAATGASGTLNVLPGTTATMTSPTSGSPVVQLAGALSAFTVSGQISYSGVPVPTFADVSFSSTAPGAFGTVTCVGSSSPISCSALFTPTGTDAVGSYNINIAFSGDSNYASSVSTQVGNYVIYSVTLTPSPIVSTYQSTVPITVTVTTNPAQTGTVTFSGPYATYGTLSATTCVLASGSCSVTFTPNGTTAVGTYSNILTATVPANGIYSSTAVNDSLTISLQSSSLAATINPVAYYGETTKVQSGAITTVLSWATTAVQPTGTITLSDPTASRTFGVITLPTGSNSITAGTACTTAGSTGICTYGCSAATNLSFTCTVTNTLTSGGTSGVVATTSEVNAVTATYAGDANFASVAGSTYLYNVNGFGSTSVPGTVTVSGNALATGTYGLTTAESPTVTVKVSSGDTEVANGTVFLDITSTGAMGTMYENGLTTCTSTSCATVTSFNLNALATPATYTLSYVYSGNYQPGDTTVTTTTGTVVVNKQTPTFGTMTFSPAATEPYGTNQAITISDTLTYLGVGEPPQGAVNYTLNSVAYTATCVVTGASGSGNTLATVETCTATVPGATIAALAVNAYTVAAAYTTDTNYAACTGSGTFTITQATLSSIVLAAVTPGSPSGGVNSSVFNATISPAINGVSVTFTDTTTGDVIGSAATSGGVASLTISTGSLGVVGGLNNFTASVTATANYSAVGPSSPVTPVYYNGILFSSALGHDFSVCYTNSNGTGPVVPCAPYVSPQSGGTLDGSQICGAGINGYSCTVGYGVTVYNFTPTAQTLNLQFNNSTEGAFSSATNCPASLAAGATCQYAFYYKPPYGDGNSTTVGLYEAGNWSITNGSGAKNGIGDPAFDRSGAVSFPATLSGYAVLTATNPVTVTPLSLTFGPQASGAQSATQDILVTNNGTAAIGMTYTPPVPAGFIVTNNCPSSLSQGASCSIGIAYKSSTVGTSSGYETITAAGQSPIQVAVSGTVVSNVLSLSTASVNMGSVNDGSTATQSVTLTNSSSASATISLATSGSTEFTYNYGSCGSSLAAGASCTVSATFAPTAAGAVSNVLTVTSSIPVVPGGTGSGPYMGTVTFSGTGVSGTGKLTVGTSTHNFGNVSVNSTGTAYGVTMTNSTGAAVTLALGPVSAPFTAATNCGSTLANGASCQFVFNFTPSADGFVSAVYSISANGGAVPLFSTAANGDVSGITLEGTGIN